MRVVFEGGTCLGEFPFLIRSKELCLKCALSRPPKRGIVNERGVYGWIHAFLEAVLFQRSWRPLICAH